MDGAHGPKSRRALLIAGPTASGKSALALALAEQLDCVVINADSMQVYADLPILSAQPPAWDRARAPHRLFGEIDGREAYSVGRWLAEVGPAIAAAEAAGRLPIVVGGTGLYFKALTQGLSAIPLVPADVRAAVRAEAGGVTPAALHARLAACDPASAARLRPSDPQRILRALEVLAATGRSLTSFQGARTAPLLDPDAVIAVALLPDRTVLKDRIDRRFEAMIEAGALAEVERLRARHLDPELPVMRALGVAPLLAHLSGTLSLADAVSGAQRASRAYARRQVTFLRHQLAGFRALPSPELDSLLRDLT